MGLAELFDLHLELDLVCFELVHASLQIDRWPRRGRGHPPLPPDRYRFRLLPPCVIEVCASGDKLHVALPVRMRHAADNPVISKVFSGGLFPDIYS